MLRTFLGSIRKKKERLASAPKLKGFFFLKKKKKKKSTSITIIFSVWYKINQDMYIKSYQKCPFIVKFASVQL